MTLREHIDNIGEILLSKHVAPIQVLYKQLYYICLGLHGFHSSGIREARHDEPFCTLDGVLGGGWGNKEEPVDLDESEYEVINQYLSDEDLRYTTSPEEFQRTSEEFQRTFAEILSSAGRPGARNGIRGFDHFQPVELTDLVSRLCDYKEGETIYNPFAGVGSYSSVFNAGDNYYGEEYDKYTWGIGVLRMWIFHSESHNYVAGDSLSPQWKEAFDLVVSTPPIGLIPYEQETYATNLFKRLPSLLKKNGRAVIVTKMGDLIGRPGKELVETGILDAVITLPRNVFYWTILPIAIVLLRADKKAEEPITLVDGSSFWHPGGSRVNIIEAEDIFRAFKEKKGDLTIELPVEMLAQNEYRITPAFYRHGIINGIDGDTEINRKMPLSTLGSFIRREFRIFDGIPETGIRSVDLTDSISEMYNVEPRPILRNVNPDRPDIVGLYRYVDKPVLLISGTPYSLKFAYISKPPVFVRRDIFIFEPNEKLIDKDYLVLELLKAEIAVTGSSVVRLLEEDLSMAVISVPPMREQKSIVRKALKEEIAKRQAVLVGQAGSVSMGLTRKKIKVATFGKVNLPAEASEDMSECMHFDRVGSVKSWIQKCNDIEAIIIQQGEDISVQDIWKVCTSGEVKIPVYILSPDLKLLEDFFANDADEYLPGKCFGNGLEEELVNAIYTFYDQKDSPAGRIREVYSRQLDAASNLDSRFSFDGVKLSNKLEEMLLSKGSSIDWRGDLRKIRDNCFLKPLSEHGFLPKYDDRKFAWGAMVSLLADRVFFYKNGEYYFLDKEILPRDLAEMLRSCSALLNQGNHIFRRSDEDTQWATMHIIMSVLCHLSDKVNEGVFDKDDYEGTSSRYWSHVDNYRYETGRYEVKALKEDSSYLYVGNSIHLDEDQCKSERVKPGDWVEVEKAGKEKRPYINDWVRIVFYSKEFHKVK